MRLNICVVFVLASIVCVAKATSLRQSKANAGLDVPWAMRVVYGNFDAEKELSTVSLPREKSSFPAPGNEQMIARPFFHALGTDSGMRVFVLLTYAVPTDERSFDCHACAPTIGMAVFSRVGPRWALKDCTRAITISGEWGKPPTAQLERIGPNRLAVSIMDVGEGQGETTNILQLLIPWHGAVDLGLERVIADDDKGDCGPGGGLPCYANGRTVSFVSNDRSDYYGLRLRLRGTDLPVSGLAHARKVSGLETLKFEDGRYVQISRLGDLTTVDHAVAKREGLR